jgi:hypothetical protein
VKKVSLLEAATEELGTQQVTLTMAVERIDTMHTTLNAKVNRVEVGQRAPQDRSPLQSHGRQGNNDTDQGGDFVQTSHKLEFPKYDGNGDSLPWLNHCEHYFHVRQMSEHKHITFVVFYLLDDAQLWFHHMELNGGHL